VKLTFQKIIRIRSKRTLLSRCCSVITLGVMASRAVAQPRQHMRRVKQHASQSRQAIRLWVPVIPQLRGGNLRWSAHLIVSCQA